jgi:hypothetical protein
MDWEKMRRGDRVWHSKYGLGYVTRRDQQCSEAVEVIFLYYPDGQDGKPVQFYYVDPEELREAP